MMVLLIDVDDFGRGLHPAHHRRIISIASIREVSVTVMEYNIGISNGIAWSPDNTRDVLCR